MPIQMPKKSKDILFERIHQHVGHRIECAEYGGDAAPENTSIECMDCGEVIIDVDCED